MCTEGCWLGEDWPEKCVSWRRACLHLTEEKFTWAWISITVDKILRYFNEHECSIDLPKVANNTLNVNYSKE